MRIPFPILLLFPLLCLIPSCNSSTSGGVSKSALNDFAKRSSLVIPASAKAIHYQRFHGIDGRIDVTLEMPVADLDPFLKASGLDTHITNTTLAASLSAKFGSFVPKIPTKFREGQKDLSGDCWLNVLVDEDSPTTARVHLTWFEV